MENMNAINEYYKAMYDGRIQAYYQPVYYIGNDGDGSRMVSAEALCRIMPKDGNILTPDQFIPALESTGEILTLDWIMIDKACSMALDIAAETDSDIVISVNFSGAHVNEWDSVERLCSVVDSYYVDHDQIEIEITETYKADDFMLNFLMKRLKDEGFRVAIDDFGEGYNSLRFIRDADFDTIKIDRSFVQNIGVDNSDAIIRGILKMADALGVRTIAEGVENSRHAVNVVCNGCNFIQGNYLMEPVPEDDFIDFIRGEESNGRCNRETVHA